jgi:hypothetical protein
MIPKGSTEQSVTGTAAMVLTRKIRIDMKNTGTHLITEHTVTHTPEISVAVTTTMTTTLA